MPLPPQSDVANRLLKLLTASTKPVETDQAYQILADWFGLSQFDRSAMMDGEKREIAWHVRVRWAKNDLDKAGWADSEADGLWVPTVAGRRVQQARDKIAAQGGRLEEEDLWGDDT